MNFITNIWFSFTAGLYAPIAAVCVLPLYPGFLSYLAGQITDKENKKTIAFLGFVVALGIVSSMLLFGFIFTALLQESLTKAISIISPIAFGILALVSLLLIFNVDFSKFFPQIKTPKAKNPLVKSFFFGFFFGAIVLPCNPAALIVLFAISTTAISFIQNLLYFAMFGVGMALPLIVLSLVSATKGGVVVNFLASHKRIINLLAGIIMLSISVYYLFFVFEIIKF